MKGALGGKPRARRLALVLKRDEALTVAAVRAKAKAVANFMVIGGKRVTGIGERAEGTGEMRREET